MRCIVTVLILGLVSHAAANSKETYRLTPDDRIGSTDIFDFDAIFQEPLTGENYSRLKNLMFKFEELRSRVFVAFDQKVVDAQEYPQLESDIRIFIAELTEHMACGPIFKAVPKIMNRCRGWLGRDDYVYNSPPPLHSYHALRRHRRLNRLPQLPSVR